MCMEWNEGYRQPGEIPLPHPLLRKSATLHFCLTSNSTTTPTLVYYLSHHLGYHPTMAITTAPNHPHHPPPNPQDFVNTSNTSYLSTFLFWFCPAP